MDIHFLFEYFAYLEFAMYSTSRLSHTFHIVGISCLVLGNLFSLCIVAASVFLSAVFFFLHRQVYLEYFFPCVLRCKYVIGKALNLNFALRIRRYITRATNFPEVLFTCRGMGANCYGSRA